MSRIRAVFQESLAARSRLAVALLLVGALLCFGLGQVLGHPLLPLSASTYAPHQSVERPVTPASGALAATPSSALIQPRPLAAPPARPATDARPPTHHSNHVKGGHHQGTGDGGSQHGNGHHHGNGDGNGSGDN